MNPVEAFEMLDLRVGRVLRAEPNERARKPSYRLWIDFGPLGEKTSSAQLRALYTAEELVGRLVVAAVNLGTRNIAGFTRRCWCSACRTGRETSYCWPPSATCRSGGGCTSGARRGRQGCSSGTGRTTRPVTAPSRARLHSMSIGRREVSNDAVRW